MSSAKSNEKNRAIRLRKKGLSYSEIESRVKVSRASLSLWLRDIPLSDTHKERLYQKQLVQHERAWYIIRQRRIAKTNQIYGEASAEVGTISDRELWLLGIALYWAEGAKQKEYNLGEQTTFSNSDPEMIKVFLMWIQRCLGLSDQDIVCSLYIHENAKPRLCTVLDFWARTANIKSEMIRTYFKKHSVNLYRKNQGDKYVGVFRVRIKRSSDINRKIAGWVQGICKNFS